MQILPHRLAADAAHGKDVVLLNDPDDNSNFVQLIKARARKFIQREFYDVIDEEPSYPVAPSPRAIHDILQWVSFYNIDLNDLIVTCYGGMSRSSSIAYLIACHIGTNPSEAAKLFDTEKHYFNLKILSIGACMMNNPDVSIAGFRFILQADRIFQKKLANGDI